MTTEWRLNAACLDADWDLTDMRHSTLSRRLCAGCSALKGCDNYAMTAKAVGIPGILAGKSIEERGQVTCTTCPVVVLKRETRGGQCWTCYQSESP